MRKHLEVFIFVIIASITVQTLAITEQLRVYKVALIRFGSLNAPHVKGLFDGLRDAGYIKGQNLRLDILRRKTPAELRTLLKTVAENYDLIVGTATLEATIAKEATDKIPIVFMTATAPVQAGLVKSIAHPGTNVTGVTYEALRPGLFGKQLQIFKEAVPSLKRLTLLYDKAHKNPSRDMSIVEARTLAARMGVNLDERSVMSLTEGEQIIDSLTKGTTDGITIVCTSIIYGSENIAVMARQKGLAYLGCATIQVTAWGALLSYAPNLRSNGMRAARYVDQILRGAKPQDLPVESPKNYELVINLKTAKEIGLEIPPELLRQADKVIAAESSIQTIAR